MDTGSKADDVKFAGDLWPVTDVAPAAVSPSDFDLKSGPPGIGIRKTLLPPAGDR